jgi:hypothetical protein
MADNRLAKGIVLVPSLLLGGAFLSAAAWLDGPAAQNRGLALTLGMVLLGAGGLAQFLPSGSSTPPQEDNPSAKPPGKDAPERDPTRTKAPPSP